jgi:hypothetical protein
LGDANYREREELMRILIMTAIIALPLVALGQTTEPQQPATQGQTQTKETETTAPTKGKKKHAHEQSKPEAKPGMGTKPEMGAKPETGTEVRGQTDVKGREGRAEETQRTETGARSSTSQTTTVNKQEFKSRHTEVFNLGRHPKDFFVQRFGASHFRLIGGVYFVFVDTCWVAVDVEGFVYTERIICPGDPDFIVVE